MKQPRLIHLAFLRYADKVNILSNAAATLKDNPFRGNLIGIRADFAKKTQERRKALIPFEKQLQIEEVRERKQNFHFIPSYAKVPRSEWQCEKRKR